MKLPFRTGIGYDVHQFAEGRKLILGGVQIEHEQGLLGHSDADVLLNAISDALLGALALGDIGKHFPDTDEKYRGADSLNLLGQVYRLVENQGYTIGNVDAIIAMQRPKLSGHIDRMRGNIAAALKSDISQISVKATTTEKLGFVGRQEGAESFASVLLINQGI
jgi:2-C-methyl-D-erythritol 2,4-cyclodiphosphate synthase